MSDLVTALASENTDIVISALHTVLQSVNGTGRVPRGVLTAVLRLCSSTNTPVPIKVVAYEVLWSFGSYGDYAAYKTLVALARGDMYTAEHPDMSMAALSTLRSIPAPLALDIVLSGLEDIERNMCSAMTGDAPSHIRAMSVMCFTRIVVAAWMQIGSSNASELPSVRAFADYPTGSRTQTVLFDILTSVLNTVCSLTEDPNPEVSSAAFAALQPLLESSASISFDSVPDHTGSALSAAQQEHPPAKEDTLEFHALSAPSISSFAFKSSGLYGAGSESTHVLRHRLIIREVVKRLSPRLLTLSASVRRLLESGMVHAIRVVTLTLAYLCAEQGSSPMNAATVLVLDNVGNSRTTPFSSYVHDLVLHFYLPLLKLPPSRSALRTQSLLSNTISHRVQFEVCRNLMQLCFTFTPRSPSYTRKQETAWDALLDYYATVGVSLPVRNGEGGTMGSSFIPGALDSVDSMISHIYQSTLDVAAQSLFLGPHEVSLASHISGYGFSLHTLQISSVSQVFEATTPQILPQLQHTLFTLLTSFQIQGNIPVVTTATTEAHGAQQHSPPAAGYFRFPNGLEVPVTPILTVASGGGAGTTLMPISFHRTLLSLAIHLTFLVPPSMLLSMAPAVIREISRIPDALPPYALDSAGQNASRYQNLDRMSYLFYFATILVNTILNDTINKEEAVLFLCTLNTNTAHSTHSAQSRGGAPVISSPTLPSLLSTTTSKPTSPGVLLSNIVYVACAPTNALEGAKSTGLEGSLRGAIPLPHGMEQGKPLAPSDFSLPGVHPTHPTHSLYETDIGTVSTRYRSEVVLAILQALNRAAPVSSHVAATLSHTTLKATSSNAIFHPISRLYTAANLYSWMIIALDFLHQQFWVLRRFLQLSGCALAHTPSATVFAKSLAVPQATFLPVSGEELNVPNATPLVAMPLSHPWVFDLPTAEKTILRSLNDDTSFDDGGLEGEEVVVPLAFSYPENAIFSTQTSCQTSPYARKTSSDSPSSIPPIVRVPTLVWISEAQTAGECISAYITLLTTFCTMLTLPPLESTYIPGTSTAPGMRGLSIESLVLLPPPVYLLIHSGLQHLLHKIAGLDLTIHARVVFEKQIQTLIPTFLTNGRDEAGAQKQGLTQASGSPDIGSAAPSLSASAVQSQGTSIVGFPSLDDATYTVPSIAMVCLRLSQLLVAQWTGIDGLSEVVGVVSLGMLTSTNIPVTLHDWFKKAIRETKDATDIHGGPLLTGAFSDVHPSIVETQTYPNVSSSQSQERSANADSVDDGDSPTPEVLSSLYSFLSSWRVDAVHGARRQLQVLYQQESAHIYRDDFTYATPPRSPTISPKLGPVSTSHSHNESSPTYQLSRSSEIQRQTRLLVLTLRLLCEIADLYCIPFDSIFNTKSLEHSAKTWYDTNKQGAAAGAASQAHPGSFTPTAGNLTSPSQFGAPKFAIKNPPQSPSAQMTMDNGNYDFAPSSPSSLKSEKQSALAESQSLLKGLISRGKGNIIGKALGYLFSSVAEKEKTIDLYSTLNYATITPSYAWAILDLLYHVSASHRCVAGLVLRAVEGILAFPILPNDVVPALFQLLPRLAVFHASYGRSTIGLHLAALFASDKDAPHSRRASYTEKHTGKSGSGYTASSSHVKDKSDAGPISSSSPAFDRSFFSTIASLPLSPFRADRQLAQSTDTGLLAASLIRLLHERSIRIPNGGDSTSVFPIIAALANNAAHAPVSLYVLPQIFGIPPTFLNSSNLSQVQPAGPLGDSISQTTFVGTSHTKGDDIDSTKAPLRPSELITHLCGGKPPSKRTEKELSSILETVYPSRQAKWYTDVIQQLVVLLAMYRDVQIAVKSGKPFDDSSFETSPMSKSIALELLADLFTPHSIPLLARTAVFEPLLSPPVPLFYAKQNAYHSSFAAPVSQVSLVHVRKSHHYSAGTNTIGSLLQDLSQDSKSPQPMDRSVPTESTILVRFLQSLRSGTSRNLSVFRNTEGFSTDPLLPLLLPLVLHASAFHSIRSTLLGSGTRLPVPVIGSIPAEVLFGCPPVATIEDVTVHMDAEAEAKSENQRTSLLPSITDALDAQIPMTPGALASCLYREFKADATADIQLSYFTQSSVQSLQSAQHAPVHPSLVPNLIFTPVTGASDPCSLSMAHIYHAATNTISILFVLTNVTRITLPSQVSVRFSLGGPAMFNRAALTQPLFSSFSYKNTPGVLPATKYTYAQAASGTSISHFHTKGNPSLGTFLYLKQKQNTLVTIFSSPIPAGASVSWHHTMPLTGLGAVLIRSTLQIPYAKIPSRNELGYNTAPPVNAPNALQLRRGYLVGGTADEIEEENVLEDDADWELLGSVGHLDSWGFSVASEEPHMPPVGLIWTGAGLQTPITGHVGVQGKRGTRMLPISESRETSITGVEPIVHEVCSKLRMVPGVSIQRVGSTTGWVDASDADMAPSSPSSSSASRFSLSLRSLRGGDRAGSTARSILRRPSVDSTSSFSLSMRESTVAGDNQTENWQDEGDADMQDAETDVLGIEKDDDIRGGSQLGDTTAQLYVPRPSTQTNMTITCSVYNIPFIEFLRPKVTSVPPTLSLALIYGLDNFPSVASLFYDTGFPEASSLALCHVEAQNAALVGSASGVVNESEDGPIYVDELSGPSDVPYCHGESANVLPRGPPTPPLSLLPFLSLQALTPYRCVAEGVSTPFYCPPIVPLRKAPGFHGFETVPATIFEQANSSSNVRSNAPLPLSSPLWIPAMLTASLSNWSRVPMPVSPPPVLPNGAKAPFASYSLHSPTIHDIVHMLRKSSKDNASYSSVSASASDHMTHSAHNPSNSALSSSGPESLAEVPLDTPYTTVEGTGISQCAFSSLTASGSSLLLLVTGILVPVNPEDYHKLHPTHFSKTTLDSSNTAAKQDEVLAQWYITCHFFSDSPTLIATLNADMKETFALLLNHKAKLLSHGNTISSNSPLYFLQLTPPSHQSTDRGQAGKSAPRDEFSALLCASKYLSESVLSSFAGMSMEEGDSLSKSNSTRIASEVIQRQISGAQAESLFYGRPPTT